MMKSSRVSNRVQDNRESIDLMKVQNAERIIMSYDNKFACGKKGCKGTLIPITVRDNIKDNKVKAFGKCPECKKLYEILLPKADAATWKPFFQAQFVRCTECGHPSLKMVKRVGDSTSDIKIKLDCMECNKDNERSIDGSLFDLVENELPSAARTLILCPTCGDHVADEHASTCPKCGRDFYCSKCKNVLIGQAKFCQKCGDPVNLGDFSKKLSVVTKANTATCPTCGASMLASARFCNECGQETVCSKCGNKLPPNAVFCNSCGDAVKAGRKPGSKR
jgi:predicted RNA-binding Zn-ribbon protein involved in translation (DUF1610 family)